MDDKNATPAPRKRSLTELTLGWLAERLRKTDSIKEAVSNGTYEVKSDKVAQSIVKPE